MGVRGSGWVLGEVSVECVGVIEYVGVLGVAGVNKGVCVIGCVVQVIYSESQAGLFSIYKANNYINCTHKNIVTS